jgi:hypothetical protein
LGSQRAFYADKSDPASFPRPSLSPQAARAALDGAGSFLTERVTDARGKPALRLRRAAAEEAAARAAAARAERADAVRAAAGFSLVLEALRDSGKPMVRFLHSTKNIMCK